MLFEAGRAQNEQGGRLGRDADGRRIEIESDAPGDAADPAPGATGTSFEVRRVKLISEALGVHVDIELDPPAELWRFPLETVSQSERGFDAGYQGTVLAFVWRGVIGGGATIQAAIRLDVSPLSKA